MAEAPARPGSGTGVPALARQRQRRVARAGLVERPVRQAGVAAHDAHARRSARAGTSRVWPGSTKTLGPGRDGRRQCPRPTRRSKQQRAG